MAFKFEKVATAVVKQLDQIDAEEVDDDQLNPNGITAMDYMHDFATEDFFLKNVRVRPQSGVSRDADNKPVGDAGMSRFGADGAGLDEENNYNHVVAMELDNDRDNIKARQHEEWKRRMEEEEKKKKKH